MSRYFGFFLCVTLNLYALNPKIEQLYLHSVEAFPNGYVVYDNTLVIPYKGYDKLTLKQKQGLKDALLFVKATILEVRLDESGGVSVKSEEGISMRFPWKYYENLKNYDRNLPMYAFCKLRRGYDCVLLGIE